MGKRLHPVAGPLGPVVARGWAADPDTLAGLTGPVDPAFLLGLPRAMTQSDLALVVALLALLTMGRTRCRAAALARVCGLGPRSLPVALARIARWVPSIEARLDGGEVVAAPRVKRRLRPDFYVRLDVGALARAPSPAHARFYALAAWAAAGDESAARNMASVDTAMLCLPKGADPAAEIRALLAWAQPLFGDARRGRVLSATAESGRATVRSVNSCHWNYDHRVAPRPWIGKGKGPEARVSILDGAWEGIDLSVPWQRVAKVCEWAARTGCAMSAARFVGGWLVALRLALAGEGVERALSGPRLLDALRRHGAARTFEAFVLDAAARAERTGGRIDWSWATPAARAAGEEARILRRMALRNPADPRLRVHARCTETGEEFTAMQFSRLVRRTMAHLRASGASRGEIAAAWRRLHASHRPDGLPARRPGPSAGGALPSAFDLRSVGAGIMLAQYAAPESDRAAYEAAVAAVIAATATRCHDPVESLEAGLAVLRWGAEGDPDDEDGGSAHRPETDRWTGLRRVWLRARGSQAEPLEAAARRILLAVLPTPPEARAAA